MKTPEELKSLKAEVEALRGKLCELTEDELAEVTGGVTAGGGKSLYHFHFYDNKIDPNQFNTNFTFEK